MTEEAYEVKLNKDIKQMSTAEMRYGLMEYQEKHKNNLEYITSLREEINGLKAELEEAQADENSPTFHKDDRGDVTLDIAGIIQQ